MAAPRPRKPVRPPANRNPLPGLLFGLLLLVIGAASGWWGNRLWQGARPALPAPQAQDCPAASETADDKMTLSASPLTGEGVIEFRFYRDGKQEATRKWIARLPLPSSAVAGTTGTRTKPALPPSGSIAQPATPVATPPPNTPASNTHDRIAKLIDSENQKTRKPPSKQKVPKPKEARPATPAKPGVQSGKTRSAAKTEHQYTIQVSAHKDRDKAEEQVGNLERWGFDGRIERAELAKGTWYRVRVGKRLTRDRASSLRNRIRQRLGVEGTLIQE